MHMVHDRLIPNASVGYRGDEAAGGRTIRVAGEIRDDADCVLRIEELRVRQDDAARMLELEGGSAAIKEKLGSLSSSPSAQFRSRGSPVCCESREER